MPAGIDIADGIAAAVDEAVEGGGDRGVTGIGILLEETADGGIVEPRPQVVIAGLHVKVLAGIPEGVVGGKGAVAVAVGVVFVPRICPKHPLARFRVPAQLSRLSITTRNRDGPM